MIAALVRSMTQETAFVSRYQPECEWHQGSSPQGIFRVDGGAGCPKAQVHQLTDEIFSPAGYHCYYEDAEKKGYSGTAIYSRHKPRKVIHGYGDEEFDMQLGGISVVSLYLPSGSSKEERQIAKYRCMDSFGEHLKKLKRRRSEYVICGDWNIGHKEGDIKNWKQNQKNSGCLPEERAWLDKVFGDYGWVDAFRWDGVSTITSSRRDLVTRFVALRYTGSNASPIMPH
jgi:hypothetical protein